MLNARRTLMIAALGLAAVIAFPRPAMAQNGEIGFVIGALLGDEVDVSTEEVTRSFDNAPLYGARAGFYGYPWGIEGSVVLSPTGLKEVEDVLLGEAVDVRTIYAEANVLLIILPGPVSPFVTGGGGLHSFKFQDGGLDTTENKLGFNFGGGVKAAIGPVGLRVDARDHLTTFDPDSTNPLLIPVIGLADKKTLHNWEFSAGIGFRF